MLLEAADIYPNEMVHIFNLNNGERFETYAMAGKRGSGGICLNGAAARLGMRGDKVIILSTIMLEDEKALKHKPRMILVDGKNKVVKK